MTAYEQAKAKAETLREEKVAVEKQEEKNMEEAKNQLQLITDNKELADMYRDNAKLGSENLSGALPMLKVHTTGKSTTNELVDGTEPKNGNFFYKPTQEQFEGITCHILTISRGFYAKGMEGSGKEMVFNQLISGVIKTENDIKPFIMYFTGSKLQNLWGFAKQASVYTKNAKLPMPMFTLTVKMTTEQQDTKFGKSWIVNFEIVKDEENNPVLVTDQGEFIFLRDSVENAQGMIEQIIKAKGEEEEPMPLEDAGQTLDTSDVPF